MKTLIFLFLTALSITAAATTPEYVEISEFPRTEITLNLGTGLQTGYLTTQDSVGTYMIGVNFGLANGIFAFEFQGMNPKHDTNEFALNNDKNVSVGIFNFVPHVKVYSKNELAILLGLGLSQVTLNQSSPDCSTNFGTFVFSGMVRYRLNEKWSLNYHTEWLGVTQTVSDQKTSFEIWSHLMGVGYGFN